MRNFVLIVCLTAACLFNLSAQDTKMEAGDVTISAGIGVIPTFFADNSTTLVPPVSLRLGYRVSPMFSISAYGGYSSSETGEIINPNESISRYRNDLLIVGLQPAIHSTYFDNWDIYGGFLIGYNIPMVDNTTTYPEDQIIDDVQPSFSRPAENNINFSGFIGASYYFGKHTGVFAEVGYGVSLLNLGVNIKL